MFFAVLFVFDVFFNPGIQIGQFGFGDFIRLEEEPVLDKDNGLQINAVVELYPEFDTINASEITIEQPVVSVTDDDVTEMMETLRKQRVTWKDVDRKPGKGDQALVEYRQSCRCCFAELQSIPLPRTNPFQFETVSPVVLRKALRQ